MKRLNGYAAGTLVALILAGSAVFPRQVFSEMRTWTSTSGSTVEAELERVSGGRAYLRSSNGKQFAIGISSLSADDKAYIRAQPAAKPASDSFFSSPGKAKPASGSAPGPAPKPTAKNRFPYAKAEPPEGGLPSSIQLRQPESAQFVMLQYGPGAQEILYAVFDPPEPRTVADVAYLWSPSLSGYLQPRKIQGKGKKINGGSAYLFEVPISTQFGGIRVKGTLVWTSGGSKWWLLFAQLDARLSEGAKSSDLRVAMNANNALVNVSTISSSKPVRLLHEPKLSLGHSRGVTSGALRMGNYRFAPGKGMNDEIEGVYLDEEGDEVEEFEWEIGDVYLHGSGHGHQLQYVPKEVKKGQSYTLQGTIDLGPIFGVLTFERTFK